MEKTDVSDDMGYRGLVLSLGVEVLIEHSDDGYQGDTRMLLRDGTRYGLLTFGWGSCSGCDALEAAYGNLAEMTELRDSLESQIVWHDSASDMLGYIDGKDWSLDYSSSDEFLALAREHLRGVQ